MGAGCDTADVSRQSVIVRARRWAALQSALPGVPTRGWPADVAPETTIPGQRHGGGPILASNAVTGGDVGAVAAAAARAPDAVTFDPVWRDLR